MNEKCDRSIRQVIEQPPGQYKIETTTVGEALRNANDIAGYQPVFCRNWSQTVFGQFQCGRLMIVQHDLSGKGLQIGENWRPIHTAAATDGKDMACLFPHDGFGDLQRLPFQFVAVLMHDRRLEQNVLDMPPERAWQTLVDARNHVLDGFEI